MTSERIFALVMFVFAVWLIGGTLLHMKIEDRREKRHDAPEVAHNDDEDGNPCPMA